MLNYIPMSTKTTKNLEGKKLYELSFLLKDPASEKVVLDLLGQHKAAIMNQSQVNSIKLAYPIKKHLSAYFGFINFEADPADMKNLSEALRFNAEVLRFLIIATISIKKSEGDRSEGRKTKSEAVSGKLLSNEALEEKLEEILK